MIRQKLSQAIIRLFGWRVVGDAPRTGILLGAPHTSMWDFVLFLLLMWQARGTPRALVKKELFRGPLGWLLPRVGAVPVDRDSPTALVRTILKEARSGEPFLLAIAAEGTRHKTDYWKPGFYQIARMARLTITLGFIDGPTKTMGFGPTIRPSGDIAADMDVIRAFYADKHGLHPELKTEPRLGEETDRRSGR